MTSPNAKPPYWSIWIRGVDGGRRGAVNVGAMSQHVAVALENQEEFVLLHPVEAEVFGRAIIRKAEEVMDRYRSDRILEAVIRGRTPRAEDYGR